MAVEDKSYLKGTQRVIPSIRMRDRILGTVGVVRSVRLHVNGTTRGELEWVNSEGETHRYFVDKTRNGYC